MQDNINDINTENICDTGFDPFHNSTEKHYYNEDYSGVMPAAEDNAPSSTRPGRDEKRAIRRFYNIGGGCAVLQLAISFILSNALVFIAAFFIMSENNMSFSEYLNSNTVARYISDSAIYPAVTLLSYLGANLIVFFAGMKLIGQKPSSLFRTRELKISNVIEYIFILCFIQVAAIYIVRLISIAMPNADVVGGSGDIISYSSDKSLALSLMYACIVAPVTEELLYRGFVMKAFSVVSQRFGIIISALFFALGHGNITQFCLTFIMGIFMGYIDIKHNSLIPSLMVHFVNNTMASVRSIVIMYASDKLDLYDMIYSYGLLAAAVIGLVILIIFCKRETFPKSTIKQQMRCTGLFLTSPAAMIAVGIYAVLMFMNTFL